MKKAPAKKNSPSPLVRGRQKDPAKREAILREAIDLFLVSGFRGCSMDEVARRANISKATLYNHFKSKNELFRAMVEEKVLEYFDAQDTVSTECPQTFLELVGAQLFDLIHDKKALALVKLLIGEAGHQPKVSQLFYAAGPGKILQKIAEGLEKTRLCHHDQSVTAARTFASLVIPHSYFMELLLSLCQPMPRSERKAHVHAQVETFLFLLAHANKRSI